MDIPLLSKEDIEKEDTDTEEKDIREQIIEFLKSKGYRHVPSGQAFSDETSDFFIKDEQSIEIVISEEIPESEIIGEIESTEK